MAKSLTRSIRDLMFPASIDLHDLDRRDRWWERGQVTEEFIAQAVGGYFVSYRLTAAMNRVDDNAFAEARMLSEGSQRAMLRQLNKERVKPHLTSHRAVLAYGWPEIDSLNVLPMPSPRPHWYLQDVDGVYRPDPNGSRFINLINTGDPLVLGGCIYRVLLIEQYATESQQMENYNMLSDEQIAQATQDWQYAKTIQAPAIAAMHDRLLALHEIEQMRTTQEHEGNLFHMRVQRVGARVAISWNLKPGFHSGEKYILLGCRTTGGFTDNTVKASPMRIVETERAGQTVDHPDPGQTYYYTFAVVRKNKYSILEDILIDMAGQKGNQEYETSPVRFSVYLPTLIELEDESANFKITKDDTNSQQAAIRQDIRRKVVERLGVRKAIQEVYEEEMARVSRIADQAQKKLEEEAVETAIDEIKDSEYS